MRRQLPDHRSNLILPHVNSPEYDDACEAAEAAYCPACGWLRPDVVPIDYLGHVCRCDRCRDCGELMPCEEHPVCRDCGGHLDDKLSPGGCSCGTSRGWEE